MIDSEEIVEIEKLESKKFQIYEFCKKRLKIWKIVRRKKNEEKEFSVQLDRKLQWNHVYKGKSVSIVYVLSEINFICLEHFHHYHFPQSFPFVFPFACSWNSINV